MKNIISILICILLLVTFIPVSFGAYKDVPFGSASEGSILKLSTLGIISGFEDGTFRPSDTVSRAQFAKMAILACNLGDTAKVNTGLSVFVDVDPGHWANGYINTAVSRGLINGYGDGTFRPEEKITYAQVVTIALRMLGYDSEDLGGRWPASYLEKAQFLDITEGITLKPFEFVSRGIVASILDRTLATEVKPKNATQAPKTLAESSKLGSLVECIVFGTSNTDPTVSLGKVETTSGVFNSMNYNMDPYAGYKVKLMVNSNGEVVGVTPVKQNVRKIVIDSVVDNDVRILENRGTSSMTFTDQFTIYYHGTKGNFKNNKVNMVQGSVLILSASLGDSYDYGVLLDPIMIGPVIAPKDVMLQDDSVGSIDIRDKENIIVIKNGKNVNVTDIKVYDVVYLLEDTPDGVRRLYVYDNKVTGSYEDAYPSKASINKVKVSGQMIELGTQSAVNKLDERPGAYKIGERITVLIGKNNKVVDVVELNASDVSHFAVVINSRTVVAGSGDVKGKQQYFTKLFKTDGSIVEFEADRDYSRQKGLLIKYDFENGMLRLQEVYCNAISGKIDRSKGSIDDIWLSKNAIILDLVSNVTNADAVVKKVDILDLPDTLEEQQVVHAERSGPFGDIQLLLLNKVTGSSEQYGILIKKNKKEDITMNAKNQITKYAKTCTYIMLFDGKERTVTSSSWDFHISPGDAMAIDMQGTKINNMRLLKSIASSFNLEAIDGARIKLNGKIYELDSNAQVYEVSGTSSIKSIALSDIKPGDARWIKLYINRDIEDGGKVRIIVVRPENDRTYDESDEYEDDNAEEIGENEEVEEDVEDNGNGDS